MSIEDMLEEINELIKDQKDIFCGTALLDKNDNIDDIEKKTFLVIYQINTTGQNPFLQFVLHKNDEDELLNFIPGKSNDYAGNVLLVEEVCRAYRLGTDPSSFKGYFRDDNTCFLFFALPDNTIDCHLLYACNDLWLLCVEEIVNWFIKDFVISDTVKTFFYTNPSFGLLHDAKNDNIYETPMIVYHGCDRKKANFLATFGIAPSNDLKTHPYVFYKLETACEENSNGALIRFAVFLGNMTFIEDLNNSDTSDSVFDQNNSIIRIAEYEQIIPLSFHYLNYNSQII